MVLEIRGGFDLVAPVTLFGSCFSCDEEYDIAANKRIIQYYFACLFPKYEIVPFNDLLKLTIACMAFFQRC